MNNIEHYFDWASTSPLDKELFNKALEQTINSWANPSSVHALGKEAKQLLEQARLLAANSIGVSPDTIYFTSGGTESDQIPLLSLLAKPSKGTVLISSIEHPAIREQANMLKNCGWNVLNIPTNDSGIITKELLQQCLTSDTMLICIMAVNNETGVIQPIYELADLITEFYKGKRKPKFHVDCVQAAGKIPLNISYPGIDSAAFSSHKICGPRGIGILYLKDKIEPFLKGGGQENGIRSGTENVLGALAFAYCLNKYYIKDDSKQDSNFISASNKFVKELSILKGCTIIPETRNTNPNEFSPYVVQAAFKNIPGNVMLRALDSKGFYISTGSACSSKKNSRPVLEAMHISADLRETSVRFSFGPLTQEQNLIELLQAVKEINNTFNK